MERQYQCLRCGHDSRTHECEQIAHAKMVDLQRALDAEREKVAFLEKKNANLVEASNLVLKVKAEQDEQLAALQARATELERDNAAMKQLFDANPSALWAQLATLQAQLRQVEGERDRLKGDMKERFKTIDQLDSDLTTLRQLVEAILLADERGQGLPFKEAMDAAAKAINWNSLPPPTEERHE